MKLYSYFRSSCSYRVRIALNYKKLDYEIVPVNLLKSEQKMGNFLLKNPLGVVPVLEIDDLVLDQSLAIIDYLDSSRRYPRICLLYTSDAADE